jgi:hypothetical protein
MHFATCLKLFNTSVASFSDGAITSSNQTISPLDQSSGLSRTGNTPAAVCSRIRTSTSSETEAQMAIVAGTAAIFGSLRGSPGNAKTILFFDSGSSTRCCNSASRRFRYRGTEHIASTIWPKGGLNFLLGVSQSLQHVGVWWQTSTWRAIRRFIPWLQHRISIRFKAALIAATSPQTIEP